MKRDITVACSAAEVIAALAEEEKAKAGGDQPLRVRQWLQSI